MDLVVLAVLILGAAGLAFIKMRSEAERRSSPSRAYQSVFTVGSIGLVLTGFGLAGGDMRSTHGWFRGIDWREDPIWWQVGIGIALLALAGVWARRLLERPT